MLLSLPPTYQRVCAFQVLDQYLSFIAPSPSLFSLLPPPNAASSSQPNAASPSPAPQPHSTYTLLNSPSSTEQQIEEEIERVASGIFSVVATMGKGGFLTSGPTQLAECLVRPCSNHSCATRKCRRDDCQEARTKDSRRRFVLCALTFGFIIRTRRFRSLQSPTTP